MLQEVEEEQKNMDMKEIMKAIREAPDSVIKYEIVSMNSEYMLHIRVIAPEANSFPICDYEVYLVHKQSNQRFTHMDLKDYATCDMESLLLEK